MSTRVLVTSVVCLGLAACGTDRIAMSSEVGGGGASSVFAPGGGGGGGGSDDSAPGGTDPAGGGSSDLGVTGGGGVLDNVIGADPVGGQIDDILGPGNPVTAILGSGSGSGLIPSAAGALAGDPDAEIVGLGILGDGGLFADLAGTDMLGGMLNTGGVVGASIAGGDDGLLGALLNDQAANPPLAPLAGPLEAALPSSALADALSALPVLGITGGDGLVADLAGTDLIGNLIGPNTPAGGGNGGLLGDAVPAGSAPLAPIGDGVNGVLNIVAGNEPSPIADVGGQLGTLPGLDSVLGTGGLGDALAPVTDALGGAPAPAVPENPLEPVTGALGGLLGGN
ncbi:MAG: hypothetical protein KF769_02840 [Parvibaculum sp.]|nr:hypothetical protein [Parvibaculum sp.]